MFFQLTLHIEHYVRVEINAAAMRAGVDPCQVSSSFLSASSEEVLGAQAETAPDDFLRLRSPALRQCDIRPLCRRPSDLVWTVASPRFSPAIQAGRQEHGIIPAHYANISAPAESAWAAGAEAGTSEEAWKLNDVKYTVDKNAEGEYVTTVDTIFAVESVTDYFTGKVVPTSDYTVVYFDADAGNVVTGSTSGGVAPGIVDGKFGTAPNEAGNYILNIYEGDVTVENGDTTATITGKPVISVNFKVVPQSHSVEGATAFEYDAAAADKGMTDTSFKYLGDDIKIGFAVDGTQLKDGEYTATVIQSPDGANLTQWQWSASENAWTISEANVVPGKYVVRIKGAESTVSGKTCYTGSYDVAFEIKALDLDNDVLTVAPTKTLKMSKSEFQYEDQLYVNGELVENGNLQDKLEATLVSSDGGDAGTATNVGTHTFKVTDEEVGTTGTDNLQVIGGSQLVNVQVVNDLVKYQYKGGDIAGNTITVNLNYGDAFNADFLSAVYDVEADGNYDNVKPAEFSWKLTDSKGNEVAPADLKHGKYTLELTTDSFKMGGKSYAGYASYTVDVIGPNYDKAVAFASIDETFLNANDASKDAYKKFEYTGEPFEVNVAAKNGNDKLVEGEDYTVAYKKNGEAVDSILDLGKYDVVVTFADGNEVTFGMEVEKATIESAKATAEFFAIPADGSAATPTFVGSTDADFEKGQQFDLSADEISVEYYEVENKAAANATPVYEKVANAKALSAEDLTEEGTYAAEITVLTTAKHIDTDATISAFGTGNDANKVVNEGLMFKVSKAAKFADVDANEWYAGAVYTAASEGYGYMTGLAGTNLFLSNAQITRAQVAQVFYNMAGGEDFDWTNAAFSDVVSGEWYGPAIAWASQAGIVTGYAGTNNFGPEDPATREQVATMIYRYMKAQGKDVTVKDEAAALAKYADGASVSDFAKTAMAYCVEQGIFGVDVDSLRPQDNLSRAEMAATSVRVQPDGAYTEL